MCDEMANKDDYLTYYREFFENFAITVNPDDQLPVKLGCYKLVNVEVVGGIIDWTMQYLTQINCPPNLVAPLIRIVIDETRKACKKDPVLCGFDADDNAYEPLKLMQTVMAKTNEVCLRYLDNSMLCSLPSPGTQFYPVSAYALRNIRKRMEDRHVIIHDLNTMFSVQEASPSSYYAVFDGHAGHHAAAYSAAHLHQFLAENKNFISNPEEALLDAFCKTDTLFLEKSKVRNSGTTALVALLRPKEKTLYLAWLGDSLAVLSRQGRAIQLVEPHKPDRKDERERIEKNGGCVMRLGCWRVNGQLAVSRAIGDAAYKRYITATPEIREVTLDGSEDFLILASDGLWDYVPYQYVPSLVYSLLLEDSENFSKVAQKLAGVAKEYSSSDNISVIVVFLKEPSKIAAEARRANRNDNQNNAASTAAVDMETGFDNANNPFTISNGSAPADNHISSQKDNGLLLSLTDNYKHTGDDLSPISTDFCEKPIKSVAAGFWRMDNEDLGPRMDDGPETDVDALSPIEKTPDKPYDDLFGNNNPAGRDEGVLNPFVEHQEMAALDMERSLQKLQQQHLEMEQQFEAQQHLHMEADEGEQRDEFDNEAPIAARDETPTPPADTVHDVGGLEENAIESESEDEWNYIKGEEANKENIDPQPSDREVAETPEEEDNMSQLNPNAAEFVPVSPTRSIPSPACRMLINDEVISQSPKRPVNVDISVPNMSDFETEIKSRPSEVDTYSNGHSSDNDHSISTPEKMENILNGKSIDDIEEFQPGSTPQKSKANEEFHFGPNAAPFTPVRHLDQSEAALSTRAVYGDESAATLDTSYNDSVLHDATVDLMNKESDPMSMSFYADKGEANPFDLNEVQMLPDESNESILDVPEQTLSAEIITLNNDDAIKTTDFDKQAYDDEKELASPLEPEVELLESTKPDEGKEECDNVEIEPNNENILITDFCQLSLKTPVETIPQDVELISTEPRANSAELGSFERLTVEDLKDPIVEKDNLGMAESETPSEMIQEECATFQADQHSEPKEEMDPLEPEKSPTNVEANLLIGPFEENKSNHIIEKIETAGRDEVKSPSVVDSDSERCDLLISKSPVCDLPEAKSPICDISEKSSVCDIVESKSPIPDQMKPYEELMDPIQESCDYTKPELIEEANTHFEELCNPQQSDVILESQGAITSAVKDDLSSPVAMPEVIDDSFVKDHIEKVETCQVEKSEAPEPEAFRQPVEHIDDLLVDVTNQISEISIDPLPLHSEQIDVKTENISPEFPEQAVVSPSEESKQDDVPTAPLNEEPVLEPTAELKDEIPVASLAAVAAVGATAGAVAAVTETVPKNLLEPVPATPEPITPPMKPEDKKKLSSVKKASATKSSTAAPKTTPRTSAAKTPTTKASPSPKTAAPKPSPKVSLNSNSSKPALSSTSQRPAASAASKLSTASKPKAVPQKPADKKPLTNGDVKPPVKSTFLAKKTVSETATAKTRPLSAAASKPTTTAKPTNPRPASAPKAAATAAAPRTTGTGLAAKARPATLSSRPIPAKTTSTTTASTKTSPRAATTTSSSATSAPKPRVPPTTAAAKPRLPLSRPMGKAPDTEKQNKDSANKITASKTSATRTSASTAIRKVDSKTMGARTTLSKTTTTTMKSTTAKKPAEIIRNPNKTKTTKIEKPKENGVSTVVTEEITVVNTTNSVISNEPELVKDNSPVDNKLLIGENTLIEANAAD